MTARVTPSLVRIAGPRDYQDIWRLFLMGHRENGLFTLAHDKVEWFMLRALDPKSIPPGDCGPRGAIGVIGPVDALEALAFVAIGDVWYSHDKHLADCFVYVDPEHRRSSHAKALINWMKQQAAAASLPLMSGVVSTERTEAKCALYRRLLKEKVGEYFLWRPMAAALSS